MDKETVLHDILRSLGKNGLTIAFSGGTDSVFLLNAAVNVLGKEKVKAVFIKSELTDSSEAKQAQQIAQKFNVPFEILHLNVLNEIRFNPISRCYLCKKKMFSELLKTNEIIADGTNADDLNAFRPGLQALKELKINSPLAEAGLTKSQIRQLSEKYSLPNAKKPSAPCLATRFVYGEEINADLLEKIAKAEDFLKNEGFSSLRLRRHKNILRLELLPADFERFLKNAQSYAQKLKILTNADYVTLDAEGLRSGSMDLPTQPS